MLMLAEIVDKMPTATGMWACSASGTIVLLVIVFTNRWAALVATALALLISTVSALNVYDECFREPFFQQAIWNELGVTWVVHSFASAISPFAAVLIATIVKWRVETRQLRIKRGLCPACAYPVGEGPICTECGKSCR